MQATWHKNLEHEGIQIEFDGKPSEEIRSKLKSAGFRWSRVQKIWYAKGYNGYAKTVAEQLATYGGEIGEPLSIEEKVERKLERADARVERFTAKAEKAEENAEAFYHEARKMAEIIPLGQPILIGHYSEGPDRRYRARIDKKYDHAHEEFEKAKYYEHRAEASSKTEARMFNLGTTLRRIKKLEAEWRKENSYLEEIAVYRKLNYPADWTQISRKALERHDAEMDRIEHEIDYWKKIVSEKEEKGLKVWKPEDFKVGERISALGRPATVEKVNKKTLKVKYDLEWMNHLDITKVPYDALSQKCKMEA
jgi:hypothetical protein